MAVATVPKFSIPPYEKGALAAPSFLNSAAMQINSATDDIQFFFQAPKSGEISKVGFKTGTVTTGCTLDVRLETVDATTGLTTGTLKDTNSNASCVVADTDDSVWKDVTFTATATVTQGDFLCLRLDVSSGTPSALNISGFEDGPGASTTQHMPSMWENDGTPSNTGCHPILAVAYSGDDYALIPGLYPVSLINSSTFDNTDTPDVYGFRFQLPFIARICGCWMTGDFDGDYVIKFYDSDGVTVLTSITVDEDYWAGYTATATSYWTFPSSVTIAANTNYWIGVEPSSATTVTTYDIEVSAAAIFSAMPGGANFALSTAKDPTGTGSWTTSTTKQFVGGIFIDGVDYTTASGGFVGIIGGV